MKSRGEIRGNKHGQGRNEAVICYRNFSTSESTISKIIRKEEVKARWL